MADRVTTFLRLAAPGARRGAREFGVPASVTLAQGALESGWGASHFGGANNYFGIKATVRNGKVDPGPIAIGSVVGGTQEFSGGGFVHTAARFRAYRSPADSFRDHGLFLRSNPRYAAAFKTGDPNAFARAIAAAGYATDPRYAEKLIAIMRANDLYRFDAGGAPAPDPPPPAPERVKPLVAAVQRDLNAHLRRLGSPELLAVDGEWDRYTERAFRRVCRVLGIAPKRAVRTYRIIAGASAQRTPEELARAAAEGAAFAARLQAKFHAHAPAPPPPAAAPVVVGGRELNGRRRRAAYIAALQRDLNAQLQRLGAPRPIEIDGEWGAETDLAFRRVCKVLGLAPERTVRTFRVIAGATAQRTAAEVQEGDTDGAAFAHKLSTHFHTELRRPLDPTPRPAPPAPPVRPGPAPRTFRIQSPLMDGDDVRAFQRLLNHRFEAWKVDKRIDEDGEYGSVSRLAARQVAHGLGLAKQDYPGGITPEMRKRIRTPSRRSPEEIERAQKRRPWLRNLRKQCEGGGADLAIAYARQHVGLREQAGNRGPLIDKWNRASGSPLGSFWCGNFCNACLMAAGFPSEPFLAVCGAIESHARSGQGKWSWHGTPQPGDLALFTIGGAANHVGIVESVGAGQVVTIEGNTHQDVDPGRSNDGYGVFRRHHAPGSVRGYARPPYAR